jgi:hypothetical protein
MEDALLLTLEDLGIVVVEARQGAGAHGIAVKAEIVARGTGDLAHELSSRAALKIGGRLGTV